MNKTTRIRVINPGLFQKWIATPLFILYQDYPWQYILILILKLGSCSDVIFSHLMCPTGTLLPYLYFRPTASIRWSHDHRITLVWSSPSQDDHRMISIRWPYDRMIPIRWPASRPHLLPGRPLGPNWPQPPLALPPPKLNPALPLVEPARPRLLLAGRLRRKRHWLLKVKSILHPGCRSLMDLCCSSEKALCFQTNSNLMQMFIVHLTIRPPTYSKS